MLPNRPSLATIFQRMLVVLLPICHCLTDCSDYQLDNAISYEVTMNKVKVPVKDTTYMCQAFDVVLTQTNDVHMVAYFPRIDAAQVVHHILLFGCDPRMPSVHIREDPEECGFMPITACRSLIGTWTMGSDGDCAHPEMGFRFGPGGFKQVYMQIHYNNPFLYKNLVDSSGLQLHFLDSLRPNDAGMLVVGQRSLQINPLGYPEEEQSTDTYSNNSVTFSSECPSRCTKHMFGEKGIYITSAVNHMHALGISQRIEVYRNQSLIYTITNQDDYNYNFPHFYRFKEPMHVLPGDVVTTTCVYKRPQTREPVCFGEATSDEMCLGFITYYPAQKLKYPWCTSMKSMKSCDRHLPQLGLHPINNCKWWEFRNLSLPETKLMFAGVLFPCYSSGKLDCNDVCKKGVTKLLTHPCMQDDVGSYMMDRIKSYGDSGQQIMDALVTCSCRHFRFCDRKLAMGFLGIEQDSWCSNTAPETVGKSKLWIVAFLSSLLLLIQLILNWNM